MWWNESEKKRCTKCYKNYVKELDKLLMAFPKERGSREPDRILLDMENLQTDISVLQDNYDFDGDMFEPEVK